MVVSTSDVFRPSRSSFVTTSASLRSSLCSTSARNFGRSIAATLPLIVSSTVRAASTLNPLASASSIWFVVVCSPVDTRAYRKVRDMLTPGVHQRCPHTSVHQRKSRTCWTPSATRINRQEYGRLLNTEEHAWGLSCRVAGISLPCLSSKQSGTGETRGALQHRARMMSGMPSVAANGVRFTSSRRIKRARPRTGAHAYERMA
ncbi:hypothetical protein X961_4110 [Burkholderia pseudomallei MSHR5613]|nr:hypothetical protein X961_4110 [Burkholderia pseudomallei MSHR5613]